MAGGENARIVPCMTCGARAERTYEGIEDDLYRCDNGHSFGVDYRRGPPVPVADLSAPNAGARHGLLRTKGT